MLGRAGLALLGEFLRLAPRLLALGLELPLGLAQPLDRGFRFRLAFLPPAPRFSEDLPRAAKDRLGQSLLPRDRERAAPAREAGVKPVVGTAGRLVELHGRADRVGPRGREILERREVRGHEGAPPARQVLLEERDRERAAFFRIGRAPDLVDERERARARARPGPRRVSPSRKRTSSGRPGSPARRRSRRGSRGRPARAWPGRREEADPPAPSAKRAPRS